MLFIATFVLLGTTALNAQRDSLDRLSVGVQGGYLFNSVSFSPATTVTPLPGISAALILRQFSQRTVGFQAELAYEQGGWAESFEGLGADYERRQAFASARIFTQLSPFRGAVQPYLQGGMFVSFPIQDQEMLPAGLTPDASNYYGRELPFRINYGLAFGLGVHLDLGPFALQLEGRYATGMSDLVKPGFGGITTSRRQAYGGVVGILYELY